jgi:hypothetical protein
VIAVTACDRSDRKKTLPRINTDERVSERTYQLLTLMTLIGKRSGDRRDRESKTQTADSRRSGKIVEIAVIGD